MKCFWIFFHKWLKWQDMTITYGEDTTIPGQFRYCEKCNKKQVRRVTTQ